MSESYSETEDDFQSTKQAPRNNNKAKPTSSSKDDDKKTQKKSSASSNKGSKQASIMGFFQKKWDISVGSEEQHRTVGRHPMKMFR